MSPLSPIHNSPPKRVSRSPEANSSQNDDPRATVGDPLPAFSVGTSFPFPLPGLRKSTIIFPIHNLPIQLQNIDGESWNDQAFLKETFKIPTKRNGIYKKVDLNFPACLLLDCSTVEDRAILANWWIGMSKQEQKDVREWLKEFYVTPTSSNKRESLYTSARGAKIAEDKNLQ